MIKYSIILPYYKRPEFESSLVSFAHHYVGRRDYEIIVIEDIKNELDLEHNKIFNDIVKKFKGTIPIVHYVDPHDSFSPCRKYNQGFTKALGEYIIFSSPEIFHESNILDGLDKLFEDDKESYYVCSCRARRFINPILEKYNDHYSGEMIMWYQHSKMRNAMFHFCSAISKENFKKVGGFDERYCGGIGFDDESFLERIKLKGIGIIPIDDLVTTHIEHDRTYVDEYPELVEVNRKLFLNQIETGSFEKDFVGVI